MQAEREAAVADLDAARATSKLLEEEVASLKQRLRQMEVRIDSSISVSCLLLSLFCNAVCRWWLVANQYAS